MALKISENNGTFHLEGNLNATTSRHFIIHFEYVISTTDQLNINIEKLKEIDASGVAAIQTVYRRSLMEATSLSIIGLGCKDIYDEFRYNKVA